MSSPADSPENPAGVVYGIITMGTLLAAENGKAETYLEAVGSAAIALLLYWLAHSYAGLLGDRLATHKRLTPVSLGRAFLQDWGIVRGALMPLLALLIGWIAGAALETAINAAIWTSVGCLIAFELLAAVRSKAGAGELLIQVCMGAAMGLGILTLRILLH